jgi:hypothetical protein
MTQTEEILTTHHMLDDEMLDAQAFLQFSRLFDYSRVSSFSDSLKYETLHRNMAPKMKREAERIIKNNNLPLTVKLIMGCPVCMIIIAFKHE